jgi:hypothetical protein
MALKGAPFDVYFVGPVKITRGHAEAAFECCCHVCKWVNYKWTEAEARHILLWHLDSAHFNPPKPFQISAAKMPGR